MYLFVNNEQHESLINNNFILWEEVGEEDKRVEHLLMKYCWCCMKKRMELEKMAYVRMGRRWQGRTEEEKEDKL